MTIAASQAVCPASPAKARGIIAVASGKGGVGKTWLAITLAHALARLDRRTLLFDGDLGLANVDVQLGLMPEHDLAGVLAGRLSLAQATVPFAPGGFDIVAGRSGCGRLAAVPQPHLAALADDLMATAANYDHVILDLGAGVDRTVRELARLAGSCIVVATDEPTALTDAYAFIKITRLDCAEADVRIVVNMRATGRRPTARCSAPVSRSSMSRRRCWAWSGATPRCAMPSATRPACSRAFRTAPLPLTWGRSRQGSSRRAGFRPAHDARGSRARRKEKSGPRRARFRRLIAEVMSGLGDHDDIRLGQCRCVSQRGNPHRRASTIAVRIIVQLTLGGVVEEASVCCALVACSRHVTCPEELLKLECASDRIVVSGEGRLRELQGVCSHIEAVDVVRNLVQCTEPHGYFITANTVEVERVRMSTALNGDVVTRVDHMITDIKREELLSAA
jgi:flagellar biosynthesis protein FlhG